MRLTPLAPLYERLGIWERIPLAIAAQARGDDGEYQRLFGSARQRTSVLPEHLLAEQALNVLALIYVSEQLNAAAIYFFAQMKKQSGGDELDDEPLDWQLLADVHAYFFTANAEAWRRFCVELDLVPTALVDLNHQGWMLRYCEERMPAQAPDPETLLSEMRHASHDLPELVTADGLLSSWKVTLRSMSRHAPC